jgi:hypothetical protein
MWRRLSLAIGCLAAMLGSFFLTLRFIEKANRPREEIDARAASERLAGRRVANNAELTAIASEIGLKFAPRMLGHTDAVDRVNEREVVIGGWLADPEGDATPIQLVVFVAGAVAARTQTQGERPDVTRGFHLYFGSEKNVAFQATFACRSGEQPVAVAVGSGGQYLSLETPRCP